MYVLCCSEQELVVSSCWESQLLLFGNRVTPEEGFPVFLVTDVTVSLSWSAPNEKWGRQVLVPPFASFLGPCWISVFLRCHHGPFTSLLVVCRDFKLMQCWILPRCHQGPWSWYLPSRSYQRPQPGNDPMINQQAVPFCWVIAFSGILCHLWTT